MGGTQLRSRLSLQSTCTQATDGPKRVKLLNRVPSQEEVHVFKQDSFPSLMYRDDKSESPKSESPKSVRFDAGGEVSGLNNAVHLKDFQDGTVGEARSFYESAGVSALPSTDSSEDLMRTRFRKDTIRVPESRSQTAGSPRRQTLAISNASRRTSERPAIHPALVASEETTQVEPTLKRRNLKRGSCMSVFCKAPKACVTTSKKSIRFCGAPLKKCATVCKPKPLVPTPRIGAEWQFTGMGDNVKLAAQHVATGAKIIWFLFSVYILIHIVVGFMTTRDYDPESFYPVKLGFSFWEKKADDGMECLDWFC